MWTTNSGLGKAIEAIQELRADDKIPSASAQIPSDQKFEQVE